MGGGGITPQGHTLSITCNEHNFSLAHSNIYGNFAWRTKLKLNKSSFAQPQTTTLSLSPPHSLFPTLSLSLSFLFAHKVRSKFHQCLRCCLSLTLAFSFAIILSQFAANTSVRCPSVFRLGAVKLFCSSFSGLFATFSFRFYFLIRFTTKDG